MARRREDVSERQAVQKPRVVRNCFRAFRRTPDRPIVLPVYTQDRTTWLTNIHIPSDIRNCDHGVRAIPYIGGRRAKL